MILVDLPHYKILAADLAANALSIIDCPSCKILAQVAYSDSISPINIVATTDFKKAYIPANDKAAGKGCLLVLNFATSSLYKLPVDIPPILQFALSFDSAAAYIVDTNNTLYQLDTSSLVLTPWGCPGINSTCTGIVATAAQIYTIWEDTDGGTLLSFDNCGKMIHEYTFSAIPTNITVDQQDTILIPFTASADAGEGVLVFDATQPDADNHAVITTLCPADMLSHQNYPCCAALSPDGTLAYIVNEDSASITIIDVKKRVVTGHIIVSRSISRLYILPDNRFALASSALFADLILIDLVNKQVLATTTPQHELYPYVAILPT